MIPIVINKCETSFLSNQLIGLIFIKKKKALGKIIATPQ
jgi:hypothetical protein